MDQNNQNNGYYTYQVPPQQPIPPQQPAPPRPFVPQRVTKNKFLTFVFALMPGAGQMYHGLIKKGVSIMLLFFGVIAIADLSYLYMLNILLPVIWFYSFFDTVNRMNMSLDELRMLQDHYLFFDEEPSHNKMMQKLFRERHLIIGWGLILVAIWIFFRLFAYSDFVYTFLGDAAYAVVSRVTNILPGLFIPVICIIIGVKLILGNNNSYSQKRTEDKNASDSKDVETGENQWDNK